ncbi:MAG: DUF3054 domain-containing protein [Brevibacillus sp.]|nr:DUF3054 domain-containing protein [Brevibacillus sp.]
MAQLTTVILGDFIAFLLFAYIGKTAHAQTVTLLGVLETAAPFFLSWLFVGWLFGVFQPEAYRTAAAAAKKTLFVWIIAGLAGLALRSILLLRIPDWPFMVITLVTIGVLLLLWRTAYAWLARRTN